MLDLEVIVQNHDRQGVGAYRTGIHRILKPRSAIDSESNRRAMRIAFPCN
jgi:hypothetical protein